ncbi:MAG: putative bifunctional diguanylate cyclase/phosphodiesterase [Coprobacillus cateniformis]
MLIYSDITEIVVQKELLEKYNQYLNELAYLDDVTKGFNQRKFDIVARETIEKAQPYEYVMIWLNVQKFKVINEIGGFDLGNQTLKYVYSEIRNHLLDNEYVARMFSDNFAILMLYDNQQKLEYRLNRCFEDINDYESNSDYKFRFSFTTGIYLIDETDIPITQIKDRAHAARKLVSPQDNDLCVYHYYDNTIRIQMLNEKDIENRAYLALQNGEFEVYFQPKYSVKKHQLSGAEALVRWNHPTRGFLSPAEFIPVFENNGFITHVDLFVFQTVCQMIRKRLDAHQAVVPVSINMSRMHFSHPHFLNEYIKIRNKYNIPFKYLELELTESIVFENIEMFINIIKSIHQAGFMCSMDDFGSGYSSLSMLKNLEVDTIKLDKSFFATKDMSYEKEKIIVKNIIDMAKALNISTVAEGIETHEQVNFLEHTECDLIQGFVYSRPIPIQNFNDLLDSQL